MTLRGAASHASVNADMVLAAEVEELERAARGIVEEEFIPLRLRDTPLARARAARLLVRLDRRGGSQPQALGSPRDPLP